MPETRVIRINLGAGSDIQPGWVNHDIVELPSINSVHDLDVYPWPWPDGSVSRIRAFDVFEHVWHPDEFIRECWRVLRPGGVLDMHTVGVMTDARGNTRVSPNYWRDPDHKRACDPQSLDYFCPVGAHGQPSYLHQRYGAAKTGGYATFEHVRAPQFVDGLELSFLLRKPLA